MLNKFRYIAMVMRWKSIPFKKRGTLRFLGKNFRVVSPENISIGNNFCSEENTKIQAWKYYAGKEYTPNIEIGDNVSFMDNCQISCCGSISIGDGTLLGPNCFITDNNHGGSLREELDLKPLDRMLKIKGPVKIGKNVWLGRNVCIMSGVCVGDGAIIGANSVVTKDIPSYCVAGGIPARVIRICDKKEE